MITTFRLLVLACAVLSACVTNPENFKSAGFNSAAEARAYIPDYLYYAKKLSTNEWQDFYNRFPEYWKDLQTARQIGSSTEFHPWYTAYAFRWTTLRRKQSWDSSMVSRLDRKEVLPGDNIFQVTYALGPAGRVVWDNDFEILAYGSGNALLFANGLFVRSAPCIGCDIKFNNSTREGMIDENVIKTLKLIRPKY